ncbi:MAG: 23S rRNA (uracil(1939)-C(5))-methyltransferase RlmD [Magnetococcales bacterium]|nr:23S rRNA (uracil(1939)-C(5))-methyltransferase RlmD [Magnetococcales bacterium]MBF0150135.1 23S rRNA (uracil(1939)-C(5))-methyltransferase RlmD [Magnetococcales bacterium]MBF0348092.1 23S rRNA (uracil(1939)-C(5))-methyltransferase RlmD [Magnetococcales bacterium]MBF0631266.1 23S rRNA (uracil(1939)-C(5))-methyltransferase RlmD [Magnetococcales bacterium]
MDLIDLNVEKLVTGGRGLARWDKMAVFIAGAVPGDHVRVRITGRRRGHATADIVSILQPGPHRTTPLCPRFGICGGCHLQHLDITQQRSFKRSVVIDSLTRIGHFDASTPVAQTGEISPVWNYRRKAGFKVRLVRDRLILGFHQAGSHRVVDLDHCPVLCPQLNDLMQPLRSLVGSLSIRAQVPQVDVMAGDRGVGLVLHLIKPLSRQDHEHCLAFARDHGLARFDVQQGRKDRLVSLYQSGGMEYFLEGMTLKFLPADFIQVNGAGNIQLVAMAMAAAGHGARAWDLFSGIGNFTLPLARRHGEVWAMEGNRSSLDRLRLNSQRAGLERIEPLNVDLFSPEGVQSLKQYPVPEVINLDPPREGAIEWCRQIRQFTPQRLVYVSCDPATFSRDAAVLRHHGGALRAVTPLDLFPQTSHVELIALFEWNR